MPRPFAQVDVFAPGPCSGNPVAVVLDGSGFSDREMQRFAHWTNLSETTFVLPPTSPDADYRVRIFTPSTELPFAGHPTLGTCHAWIEAGHRPAQDDLIVQECAAGLIPIRRDGDRLAFAAPPLVRSGPVEEEVLERLVAVLGIRRSAVVEAAWCDNGPRWAGILLGSAEEVLAVRPGNDDVFVGIAGPHPPGSPVAWEVRAFFSGGGQLVEDPVTGSFNAGLAQWLLESGRASAPYVAAQGTVLGRSGRVHVSRDDRGTIWVGGETRTLISGVADPA